MTFDIVTIFPAMIREPLAAGILGRAIDRGTLDVQVRDLRDFTTDRHRVVDDVPYGGGPGMVLKPDPIFRALDAIEQERGTPLTVILTSPQGRAFNQAEARRLTALDHIAVLCGRYEGFDDRVRRRVTDELSIGDYVLTGGELPALVIPQFTRPPEIAVGSAGAAPPPTMRVPDVLLSGNHAEIRRWRKRQALSRTLERRPELIATAALDDEERELLRELQDIRVVD
jgi:tRNA (guanine37-N1)-methyltransferase